MEVTHLINLKRNESNIDKPSNSSSIKFKNKVSQSNKYGNVNNFNKLTLINSIGNYNYEHNSSLNDDVFKSHIILSSDNLQSLSYTS